MHLRQAKVHGSGRRHPRVAIRCTFHKSNKERPHARRGGQEHARELQAGVEPRRRSAHTSAFVEEQQCLGGVVENGPWGLMPKAHMVSVSRVLSRESANFLFWRLLIERTDAKPRKITSPN